MQTVMSRSMERSGNSLWKQMFLYFLPILFGTFFQQLYNTADAVIVGNYVGKEALASVGGSSGAIINLLVGFFVGLSGGATVIIAQGVGARDKTLVSNAVHTGIALAIAAGLLLMVLGSAMAGPMLRWMDTPSELLPLSRIYLIIYFLGMIPNLIYNIGSGILRAVGDSKRPLYFLIITTFVNIALDFLFVAVFKLGVPGVALATIISQAISAAMVMYVLIKTKDIYRLWVSRIRFHPKTLKQIIRIGIPAGIQSTMYSMSNLLIQASINSFGTDVVAAWTAFTKLDALNWMGSGAFGTTVATFAGQSYGACDYKKMRRIVRIGAIMNAIYAGSLSIAMVFGGQYAMRLFLDDPSVIAHSITMIRYLATGYVLFIPIELLAAVCRSAGDTLRPTVMTALGICGFRILWISTVLQRWHTLEALAACYPLSWVITSILFLIYYYRGNWLQAYH